MERWRGKGKSAQQDAKGTVTHKAGVSGASTLGVGGSLGR